MEWKKITNKNVQRNEYVMRIRNMQSLFESKESIYDSTILQEDNRLVTVIPIFNSDLPSHQ